MKVNKKAVRMRHGFINEKCFYRSLDINKCGLMKHNSVKI